METYRKNSAVLTETETQNLLTKQDDFMGDSVIGEPAPRLDSHLMKIWNGGTHLDWEWSDENQTVYDRRIAKEAADVAELTKLETDNAYFKKTKIKPWRDRKLVEWIDTPKLQDINVKYSGGFKTWSQALLDERTAKHDELCDWPSLTDFDTYKDDDEIDALKPSAPSWITE